jgi:D-3-phosphoglycerate dehydrogenase
MVRNGAIAGVLAHSESVNRINAASVAEERGIRLHEERKEATSGGAGSVLKLTLHTSAGNHTASATVLHGVQPRLLSYDGIDIEAPLQGTLICIRNRDVPGVVGRVGTVLGEMGVNIANFALGRGDGETRSAGQALSVIQVDAKPSLFTSQMLDALRAIEPVTDVRLVELPMP